MTAGTGPAGGGAEAAASAAPALATTAATATATATADGDAFPDRPYRAVYDCGPAPDTTHILEVSADDDGGGGYGGNGGQFSGYAACGAAPDGWVWSPSGMVSCKACLLADKAGGARPEEGRRP